MPNNKPVPATDGDIYLNDGDTYQNGIYYPDAPEAQTAKIADEEAIKAASYPVLGKVHSWFKEQIDKSPNITNIQMTALTVNGVKYERNVSIEAQALAFQLMQQLLIEKAAEFKDFAEENDA
jgi:hypothetical protein